MAIIILIALSAVVFVVSSEAAFKLEKQNYFDFANPVYVLNVLVAIGAVAIGGVGLIELHKITNEELEERK